MSPTLLTYLRSRDTDGTELTLLGRGVWNWASRTCVTVRKGRHRPDKTLKKWVSHVKPAGYSRGQMGSELPHPPVSVWLWHPARTDTEAESLWNLVLVWPQTGSKIYVQSWRSSPGNWGYFCVMWTQPKKSLLFLFQEKSNLPCNPRTHSPADGTPIWLWWGLGMLVSGKNRGTWIVTLVRLRAPRSHDRVDGF